MRWMGLEEEFIAPQRLQIVDQFVSWGDDRGMSPDTPPALLGSYSVPAVEVGDIEFCEYRLADCRVTSWNEAPIRWPRCNKLGVKGGSGLLVTEELVRAIKTESAMALMHWFGVGEKAVWNWRKRFVPGKGNWRTPGSRAELQKISEAGAAAIKTKEWTDEELQARSELSKRLGLRPTRWGGS